VLACQYGFISLEPILSYNTHKFLHLLGGVLFLGNITVGPVWIVFAKQTKDITILKFCFKMLLITDLIVTLPAIDLTIVNGLFLADFVGGINANYWLRHSVLDLLVLWVLVFPIHKIQDGLYKHMLLGDITSKVFKNKMLLWMIVGGVSLIPVAHIFYLMLYKVS